MLRRTRISYRPPLGWSALLGFLEPRAIPGVEAVAAGAYRRTVSVGGRAGRVRIAPADRDDALVVELEVSGLERVPGGVRRRVRDVFDLDVDVREVRRSLRRDPHLRTLVGRGASVRVPGAWDPFELAVRAVLGQQVTVRGATTLAGRLVAAFGQPVSGETQVDEHDECNRLFPEPSVLADADVESIGLPGARGRTLRALARAACDEPRLFDRREPSAAVETLRALPGIGDWTAQYIAMRALRCRDAFPAGDLGLRKGMGGGAPLSARALAARAREWSPWRAYAAMALWGASS